MRTNNNPLISVIIPASKEAVLTAEWAKKELAYIPHQIIIAPTWVLGMNDIQGEYVCFLEKDCVLSEDYFEDLLEGFTAQSSFRKLAVVAPSVGVNSYLRRVYGYRFESDGIQPSTSPSSVEPYLAQVVYLPGALIRRSALGFLAPSRDTLGDSATACIYFWDHGQRVVIDPNVLYVSTEEDLDRPYSFTNPVSRIKANHVLELFKREDIG